MTRFCSAYSLCLVSFFFAYGYVSANEWTQLYCKKFDEQSRLLNISKKEIIFSNVVKPFTQLIFSWNIVRPQEGYFSFYIQVRDAATQKWGMWHKMIKWGFGIQHTYLDKGDGFSSYVHVRLEIEKKKIG